MITTKPIIISPLQHLRIYRIIAVAVILMFAIGGLSNSVEATERTFYVNSTDDEGDMFLGDGECNTMSPDGECTLRAALDEVFGLYQGLILPADTDVQTIVVPAGTYVLTNPTEGLGAGGNIVLEGAGRDLTIIDGNNNVGVLSVTSGVAVEISSLTITHGEDASGAGIFNQGNLVLTDVAVSNNYADVGSGGGIRNFGSLTLEHVQLSGNTAEENGGGIDNVDFSGATLTMSDSTLYRNRSLDTTGLKTGGGIYNGSGCSVIVKRSTFEGNSAPAGGGIYSTGSVQLTNVTFYANKGTTTGGAGGAAIYNNSPGQLWLWNVTIASNESTIPAALTNSGNIEVMAHTIVADNTGGDCNSTGTVNALHEHHNLAGDSSCSTVMTDPSDQTSTDPKLLTMADNGGPTNTIALASDSPAIDAGGICMSGGLPLLTDQRGWPRTVDGVRFIRV
jgi:predicted outer membrane repeat protein